jgi:outer membrane protein assembly factor BamD (BamD/ComL family)
VVARAARVVVLLGIFARYAPYQCARSPEATVREETPAEALYHVAQKLHADGDEQGYKTTLRYIVDRYPSSRFAVAARADLDALAGDAALADSP